MSSITGNTSVTRPQPPMDVAPKSSVVATSAASPPSAEPWYMQIGRGAADLGDNAAKFMEIQLELGKVIGLLRQLSNAVAAGFLRDQLNLVRDASDKMAALIEENVGLQKQIDTDTNVKLPPLVAERDARQVDLNKATTVRDDAVKAYNDQKNIVDAMDPMDPDYDNQVGILKGLGIDKNNAQDAFDEATRQLNTAQGKVDDVNRDITACRNRIDANNTTYAGLKNGVIQATSQLVAMVTDSIQKSSQNKLRTTAQDRQMSDQLDESLAIQNNFRKAQADETTRQHILRQVGQQVAELAEAVRIATREELPQGADPTYDDVPQRADSTPNLPREADLTSPLGADSRAKIHKIHI